MSLLIRRATIIAMDAEHGAAPFEADILVEGDRIAAIGSELSPPEGAQSIDGADRLVVPGLVNGHLHSFAGFQRGRYDNLPLELWMLYAYPPVGARAVSDDFVHLRTLLVGLESLKSGVTCVLDDVIETPRQSLGALDATYRAYEELGIRASCSGYVLNTSFVDTLPFAQEVFPDELLAELRGGSPQTADEYLDFSRQAIERHHGSANGRLRYVVSPSAPHRCSTELLAGAHDLAVANDLRFHLHAAQTKSEVVTGLEFYGKSLIQHMSDEGVLSDRATLAHAMWVDSHDIDLMAQAGCTVVHNANSNLRCGMGLLPFRALRNAGVNVALGTDGVASNGSARLLDVMRTAALIHKLGTSDYTDWITVEEVLGAATIGGARALGLEAEIGSLEVGKKADMVLFDMKTLAFTPRHDPSIHLVYSETGSSIDQVVVDGTVVVEGGQHVSVNEAELIDEVHRRLPAYQDEWTRLERENQRFEPYFAEVHRRCSAVDVGFTRYTSEAVQQGDEGELH